MKRKHNSRHKSAKHSRRAKDRPILRRLIYKNETKGANHRPPTFVRRLDIALVSWIRFVSRDLWRITDYHNDKGLKKWYVNTLKVIYMSIRGFIHLDLPSKASSLTYSTVLSIVPLLAVIVGVAKGFGFQQTVYDFLVTYLPSHRTELEQTFAYVENYLSQVQGGLFVGVGFVFLLYTVFNLLSGIEKAFNDIWETERSRNWARKFSDYLALLLILPILMTTASGLTLVMTTVRNSFIHEYLLFTPILERVLNLAPFVLIILIFTSLFMLLPRVKVRLLPALIAGVIAGITFQIFQGLYMNGVLWISRYNAIYGGFAAFPLFLLWMQLTWIITLFSARLSFSIQNVHTFAYYKEASNMSSRYRDFFVLVVMSHITKRFTESYPSVPHNADSLSEECQLPHAVVSRTLQILLDTEMIIEVQYGKRQKVVHYQPAIDPEKMTVGYLLQQVDKKGNESFYVNKLRYRVPWQCIARARLSYTEPPLSETLIRDVALGIPN